MDRIIYKAQYHGFPIYIKRFEIAPIFPSQRNTWLCGYVEIDRHHLLFGCDMDELENIDCHGGITFASVLDETDTYCIGFDCNHLGDNIKKHNKEFAIRECIYIIEQISGTPRKEARKIADDFPVSCMFEPFDYIFEKESNTMKTRGFIKRRTRKVNTNAREVLEVIRKMNLADKLTILREVNRMLFDGKEFYVGDRQDD